MWKTRFLFSVFFGFLNSVKFQVTLKSVLNANEKVAVIRFARYTNTFPFLKLQAVFLDIAGSSSLDDLVYLFVCLVRKLFFKMHLLLQIWTDPYDIRHESSLGSPAFGVCSAWRYGAFWRFGDHQQNGLIYSDATN